MTQYPRARSGQRLSRPRQGCRRPRPRAVFFFGGRAHDHSSLSLNKLLRTAGSHPLRARHACRGSRPYALARVAPHPSWWRSASVAEPTHLVRTLGTAGPRFSRSSCAGEPWIWPGVWGGATRRGPSPADLVHRPSVLAGESTNGKAPCRRSVPAPHGPLRLISSRGRGAPAPNAAHACRGRGGLVAIPTTAGHGVGGRRATAVIAGAGKAAPQVSLRGPAPLFRPSPFVDPATRRLLPRGQVALASGLDAVTQGHRVPLSHAGDPGEPTPLCREAIPRGLSGIAHA